MEADDRKTEISKRIRDLFSRRRKDIVPGLDFTRSLLTVMGNPEREYAVIHVAGTNGKGSVCAMLESILRKTGCVTGLYTSPHLVSFNERVRVNGLDITDEELLSLLEAMEEKIAPVVSERGREPTFFEYTTALAFEHFRRKGVKIAVVETGMGGKLDATNIVTPVLSVITRIDIDHPGYLGGNIPDIAGEKCGIIKPGRPVVCGKMDDLSLEIVKKVCAEKHTALIESGEDVKIKIVYSDPRGFKLNVETMSRDYGTVNLPLQGDYQVENMATVLTSVDILNDIIGMDISADSVKSGLSDVAWPGRFHFISENPPIIIDGAHNVGAAAALSESMFKMYRDKQIGLIFGVCSDKDMQGILGVFKGKCRKMWAVPLKTDRSRKPADICSAGKDMGYECSENSLQSAVAEAGQWAKERDGVVCITGSLYLAGETLGLLREGKLSTD